LKRIFTNTTAKSAAISISPKRCLAVGDRYEKEIAANREADAKYR